MAYPNFYTGPELKTFMLARLGHMATLLGWTDNTPQLAEAVRDVELACGVDDIEQETGMAKVRSLATYYAWEAARRYLATMYTFSADGGSYNRDQMYEHASKEERAAYYRAVPFMPGLQVKSVSVQYPSEPYVNEEDDA